MKLTMRSWLSFLRRLHSHAQRSRKQRPFWQKLRPLMLQDLEPRQLLTASLQVFIGGTQFTSGSSDSFGTVNVGASDTQSWTLKNVGNSTLTINSDSLPNGFSTTNSTPINIAPQQSSTFSVNMNTAIASNYSGALMLSTNDPNNANFMVTLSGTVQQGSGGGGTIELFDGSTQLANGSNDSFPSVTVGSSDSKSYRVQNIAQNTLTVSSVNLPSGYNLNTSLPLTVPPNQSASFSVSLNTSTAGTYSGQLLVQSTDSAHSPLSVNISGTVTAPPAPSMSLSDGSTSIANGSSDSFGTVIQGTTATKSITVSNSGTATLSVSSISLPNDYTLQSSLPLTVPAGGSTTFVVALGTSSSGTFAGQMIMTTNDTRNNPYNVSLSATVSPQPPVIGVVDGIGVVTNDPSGSGSNPVDFGSTYVGTPIDEQFDITNSGSSAIAITSGSLVLPSGFSLVGAWPTSISPHGSVPFTVEFNGTSAAMFSGELSFQDGDPADGLYQFGIRATATVPPPAIAVADGSAQLSSGGTDSFGNTVVGVAIQKSFSVTNTGGQTLTINSASVPAGFTINSSLPMDIAPGASAVFQVTMQANATGYLDGPLVIGSNSSPNNSFMMSLSGSVTGSASLQVFDGSTQLTSGGSDSLGNVTVGQTASKTLTLTNAGGGSLVVNSASTSSGLYLNTSLPLTIPAGQSVPVSVSEYAYSAGNAGGQVMFQSNDPSNPMFVVNITAVASGGGTLQISDGANQLSNGATADLGTVPAGTNWSKPLTVTNTGMGSLTISSVSVPSGFSVNTSLPLTIGPYQTASIVVGLTTSTAGTYSGPITITSDDANNPTYTIDVTTVVSTGAPSFELFDGPTQLSNGDSDTFAVVPVGVVDVKSFRVYAPGHTIYFGTPTAPSAGGITINSVNLPTGFYLSSPLPLTVAAGQSATLAVGLTTSAASTYRGSMTINATSASTLYSGTDFVDPTNYSMTVNLSATVTGSQSALSVLDGSTTIANYTGSDTFGTTTVGSPISKTFVVSNNGSAAVTLSNLSLPGGFSLVGSFPSSVAANGTATFEIQMNAASAGGTSGTLSFNDSEAGGSSYTFIVSGTVNQVHYSGLPQISLSPTANADEATLTPGTFTFTTNETGIQTNNIRYILSGTAIPGADYMPPLLATAITSSSPSSVVEITPIDNGPFNAVRQEIVVPPATGGTYTLSLGSNATSALPYNANAADVQDALSALVGAGNVSVEGSGTAAQPFVVAWKGNLLTANVAQLTGDGSSLLGAVQPSVDSDSTGVPPSSSVQQVGFTTLGTTASSGDMVYCRQFTLTFNGQTTQPIYCNAMASTVQTTLTALSTVGSGNVKVIAGQSVGGQQTYLVYFQGALANQSVPQIAVNLLPWTWPYGRAPGTPSPIQAMLTAGSAGQNASQTVSIPGATGGTFTLSLDHFTTSALAFNASSATVQAALEALLNVGAGNLSVTGNDGGSWTITFIGAKSDQPIDLLAVDPSQLAGGQIQASSLPAISGPLTVTLQVIPDPSNFVMAGQSSATIQITDGQPTMTVSEGGNNIANGRTAVNFGSTPFGQPVSETFQITNSGNDTLVLDPGSLTLPTGFTLSGIFPTSIAAGASAYFMLQMSAASAGPLSGSVSFTNNDLANTVFTFTVQGNVSQPVPKAAVDLYGPGHLTVTPVPDNTGSVNFGQTNQNVPISEDFRIDNFGQAALALTPASLILPTGFMLVGSFPSSVAPGESQDFTLQFQATTIGTASGTVSFATNDSLNSLYSFAVSGTVTPPAPVIEVFDRGSLLKSGASTITFATVAAGAANSATETLTITNAGNALLTLDSSSVTLPSGYSLITPFSSPVAAGGSTTMVVQLNDTTDGTYTGALSFGTNDGTANPFTATLMGQVLPAPAIKIYDGSTLIAAGTGSDNFGAASQGAPLTKQFTIVNTGSSSINITSALTLPSGFSVTASLPPSLTAGQSATFAIQLNAANIGTYAGTASFSDTDTGNDPYTFQISGQVVPPGPTNVMITGFQLVNNTNGSSTNPVTYDPRVTGVVNGTFTSGYVVVQFDDSGNGTLQGSTSHITSAGTSFTYDPRTGDPSLASGSVNLRYRIASFNAAGAETDGPWNSFQFTLIPVPVGAHVDHLALVNDTGTSANDGLTYDPHVTGVVKGPFVGNSAQVDFTIIPATGNQATGVASGILFAGQPFTFNPESADPALAGYAGPLTLQYYAVDLDASGKVVHTGNTQTFNMTLYAPTPQVSISGFGLLDDTDPTAPTLSTADPRVTGRVSNVPVGETVSVEFSHHGDGVVNGSVSISPSMLSFTYDPRTKESALANYVGLLNFEYRTVEIDPKGGEIDGPWTSFRFSVEQATSPATIQNLKLSNVTIAAGPPPVTSDPTLSGSVIGTTISGPPIVQIDTNGDGIPDGSVTAGMNGSFSIVPATLPFGNETVNVRAVEYDYTRTIYLYGAWTSIAFNYQPPPAPTITSFTLANDTGGTSNPDHTTNDSLKGTIATPPSGYNVGVEFDTTGSGMAVASVAVMGTTFSFTPDWLPLGQVTVKARTMLTTANGVVLDYGIWTPLTFTYLGTPGTAPTVYGLQLAHQDGASGGVPTASDPTLNGTISAASGNAYQTVEYDINGDGVADGTTTTDANGDFTFTPHGLAAGTLTIAARAKVWDSQSQSNLDGAWQSITFVYQPVSQQPINVAQFALANNLSGSGSTPTATDPTVVGQLAVANLQSAPSSESAAYVTVQIDTNAGNQSPANYAPNASTTADASGAFQFTASGLSYGSVTIAARAEYYDYSSDSLAYGPWATSSFNYEQLTYTPPNVDSFTLASNTGGSSTANPTVTGHLSGDTWAVAGSAPSSAPPSATTFVEFDTNGDGKPDGYAWPDANGNFVYTPKYVSYGSVTISARVESWSPTQNALVAGSWIPVTFTYVNQPNTAPVLTSLGLADSTGMVTTTTTSTDTSPVLAGQVTYQSALSGITIQFDTTGSGTPNATAATDDYGRFQFTPSGLTTGSVTIHARTYVIDDVSHQVLIGPWTPFTFTWQPPATSPLSIGSLTLVNGTADSSGNLSASDPTVSGQLTGNGDMTNQIVQFDTNAGSQSAGSYTPNVSTTTDSAGNFTFTPSGLAAGSVTIAARVEDTAADGTPSYSPWTLLSFTLNPTGTVISHFALANPSVVNGSANQYVAADPTVTGSVAPAVTGGASVSDVTVEFDTRGDGQPDASVQTNNQGQFTFTPTVEYGTVVTVAARTDDWIDGVETPSTWMSLTFLYTGDPSSAAAQTDLTSLTQASSALATAQATHDTSLTAGQGNYITAQTTAASGYHQSEASASNAYQNSVGPAESTYASQVASANAGYDTSASQAASSFASSIASFAGNTASYSIGNLNQWPDAPAAPSADDSYQPSPPVPEPTYSGPTFDVQQDAGYQSAVTTAESSYDTAIQAATENYNLATQSAQTTYQQEVELAEEQRYQALQAASGIYYITLGEILPATPSLVGQTIVAGATQALVQAEALTDQGYTLSIAQAQQNENDSVAQATHDQAYAVADAESALAQAVANANAAAFADWASVLGTPWAQYQSQLAANETQFFANDAPAQDAMAKSEADAQYTKAKAIDLATSNDEMTVANALEPAQVNDSLAQQQLTIQNAQASLADNNALVAANAILAAALQQIAQELQDAESAAAPGDNGATSAATAAAKAEMEAAYTQNAIAHTVAGTQFADQEISNDLVADPIFTQNGHDYELALATAEATFHQDNANADKGAIISTAQADQTYSDLHAGYQASLDVANAQAEQAFAVNVANQYASQVQAWAVSDSSPWAALQSRLALADMAYTQAVTQSNVDHVIANSTANTNWTVAQDAAEEQQIADDASSLASSVVAAAAAQTTAATTVAGKVQSEFNQDVQNLAAFRYGQDAAGATEGIALAYLSAPILFDPNNQDPVAYATLLQTYGEALKPLDANAVDQLDSEAVDFATIQANANKQLNSDEADAAYNLSAQQADHERTSDYQQAEADQTLAIAQAAADEAQARSQAVAQANLDLSSTAAQQVYNVAVASDLVAQTAAVATADPSALTDYWAAVAAANAAQATANQTVVNEYETTATTADVTLSDDQATAEYNYALTTSTADLNKAKQIADAVQTQSVSDAGYTQQAAHAAAASFSDNEIALAQAQNTDASAVMQVYGTWVDDWYAATITQAQNMEPWPPLPFQQLAAYQTFGATVKADAIALTPQYGNAAIALAQTTGQADVTLATETGNEVSDLAAELADDANTEASQEQAATLTDAQNVDTAAVTRAAALAQAQASYALTTGNAQIAETIAEGGSNVTDATCLATAEANYQVAVATDDDNAARTWASSDGSPLAAFDAAYADANLSWLTATSSTYVTDKTAQSQADANYANQAAVLDASLSEATTAQDGTLAVTQAQLYQTEQDTIAGYDQSYAIAQVAANGADLAGRMAALANRSVASAQDSTTYSLTLTQDNENYQIAAVGATQWVADSPGIPNGFSWVYVNPWNAYGISEVNANFDWVTATTPVDSTQQTTLATADQARADQEAAAQQTYAQEVADAQWTHDEAIALVQDTTAVTLAGYEQSRESSNALANAALQSAEYSNAASVMTSFSSAVSTPWAQYLAGVAGAASTWWSSNESAYLAYQSTLAGDQATESIAIAQAVQIQSYAMADADHALAYAEADSAYVQSVNDDAAQQAEQAADATNDVTYQQSLAQGDLDQALMLPGFDFMANLSAVDQTYLSAELNAQNTLATTTNTDALNNSTSLTDAQLAWTESTDAATEAYLYASAQADNTQSDADAQAVANYQTSSSASYASAMQSFDQMNSSPWADYTAAIASAQATLSSNTASAAQVEQIALADAGFTQSTAEALAQQTLADAQAIAATNLSNAQQSAESNLASAEAVFNNDVAFQFSTVSDQLPDVLVWGSGTPLIGWQTSSVGLRTERNGVTLPLAMPYLAGDPLASGFGATSLNDFAFSTPSFQWYQSAVQFFWGQPISLANAQWAPWTNAEEFGMMVPTNLMLGSSALIRRTFPDSQFATFAEVPAPQDFVNSPGTFSTSLMPGVPYLVGPQNPPPILNSPLSDDAAHQDYVNGIALRNPSSYAASDDFDDTALGNLSDRAQPPPNTNPTAGGTEQQVQADAASERNKALAAALDEVRTQLARVNFRDIPFHRIDAMVTDHLAFRYSKDPSLVFFATLVGDRLVMFVLKEARVRVYLPRAGYDSANDQAPIGAAYYQVVYTLDWPATGPGGRAPEAILADKETQQYADYFIEYKYLSQKSSTENESSLAAIDFIVHSFPVSGTADYYFVKHDYVEGTISLAGDVAFFLSLGGTKLIRIAAIAIEAGIGGARAAQGVYALQEGKNAQAAGYFGEAMLRFIGVSAGAINELKLAQAAKAAARAGQGGRTLVSGLTTVELEALRATGLTDDAISAYLNALGDVYYFRGTSPGFAGNPALQKLGISPVSIDPLVATVFALESKGVSGRGVVLFGSKTEFTAGFAVGNTRKVVEREIAVSLSPKQFAEKSAKSISADQARKILSEIGIADLPPSFRNVTQAKEWLDLHGRRMSPTQIKEFLAKATEN